MSISTKTGDKGKTSLWSGERIEKSSSRVEAYGTVDELNSFIGEAKHYVKIERVKEIIVEIQDDLFKVGGSLASIGEFKYPVTGIDVDRITGYVHEFEKEISFNGFVIPGSTIQSAKLDICTTIARRCERRVVALSKDEEIDGNVKKYLNRLSDLIYIMARYEEKSEGKLLLKEWG
ncbi:cob(I)yrinic acid a,c-diamide adenosyltransferase [uncultured Ilyobacter sp.]|uniref:cob(I)yrinic acid a,c-diamide adenosyltransferase n=1 Tax=uncultured Ilyobacter sp. TaxID=544433 RepID=UPI0029F55B47|nr:cob(I)yrinic acid a,c-diamide adenosyltransferase [uncultured Ilyobacter sp.]